MQQTVCGETCAGSRGSCREKGYEDSLPDHEETTWRHWTRQDLTINTKDRSTITEEKAKVERWREHFQQLLNRCDPHAVADISEAELDQDTDLEPITIQEVKDAIKKLKNDKSPGDDCVYTEMLKA